MLTGDPLHNLTELHITKQHTTELHTTQRFGGILVPLCASRPDSNVDWPHVGPTSVLSSEVGSTLAQPTLLSDWLGCEEG